MVLVEHTRWKLRRKQWTGTTNQLIEDLEAAYDNAPNMFSIRIHHGGKIKSYPSRMYVSGRIDIFDMVDIDLFIVVALNIMVPKLGYTRKSEPMYYDYLIPLTSLDEGLYALACEENVRCLATLVRSFKLIEVYVEHDVTALDSYLREPRFRATLKEINDEPVGSIAANSTKKMLLLTWHESSETPKKPVCFVDVAGSGVDSLGLSHDESFGVDDLDLNLNEEPDVNLNVSQVETQFELPVSEDQMLVELRNPFWQRLAFKNPLWQRLVLKNPLWQRLALSDGQFFFDDEGIDTEYDVQSSEDVGTDDDDDDVDEDFLLDEKNEIVEPVVDVHLFGISMDLPFDKIGVTNLVSGDVLEGEDVDVISPDGFDSDHGNDEETNYIKRRLDELGTEMEGVINASGQWKYSFYTGQEFSTPKEAKDKVYLDSIKSKRNMKLYKNDGVVKTHTDTHTCLQSREIKHCTYKFVSEKIFKQVRVNLDIPVKAVQDQLQRELEVQISMSKAFRAKAKAEIDIRGDNVLQYSMLRDYVVELQSTNPNTTVKIAVERNTYPSLPTRVLTYICLGALKLGFRARRRDMLGLDGAFMKGPFSCQVLVAVRLDSNNGIYPLAYALVEAENKSSWSWFLQCLGDDIDLHPNSNFTFISDRQKAKFDLLLNNICKIFNGKIVRGRHKPVITLLEYIMEYCMKRIVNVQGVIDKCTGPLTHTATRIIKSIKKEAHLMKVQWNRANKYQVSSSLGDQCVVDNMALNDEATPTPGTWVNPCYWLSTWKETYSHKVQPICGIKYWEKSTCLTTLLPPKHHVYVGRPRKKRKRSKHDDEPFVKDAGQDGSGGSSDGAIIGLSTAVGESGQGGAGIASQGSSHGRWTKSRVQTERISPQKKTLTQPASQPSTSSQVPVSETRNAYEREMGDGVPTQSSAAGGASEWRKDRNIMKYQSRSYGNRLGKPLLYMPSETVEQRMDDNVSDEIDGPKGEQVPNHVVKKGFAVVLAILTPERLKVDKARCE
nr:hypothetical protein [Tanacetum cinerariifolium]